MREYKFGQKYNLEYVLQEFDLIFSLFPIVCLTKRMIMLDFYCASYINVCSLVFFLASFGIFSSIQTNVTNNWRYFAVKFIFGGEKYFAYHESDKACNFLSLRPGLEQSIAYIASGMYVVLRSPRWSRYEVLDFAEFIVV